MGGRPGPTGTPSPYEPPPMPGRRSRLHHPKRHALDHLKAQNRPQTRHGAAGRTLPELSGPLGKAAPEERTSRAGLW